MLSLKPSWLKKKIDLNSLKNMKALLRRNGLHTVCEEALCPNIGECFSRGVATFLILGRICTRGCRFCNVKKGKPFGLDKDEPLHVAQAAKTLNLKHVVITSVTRDDLEDGGAQMFLETVKKIKSFLPQATVEILIPDFRGKEEYLDKIAFSGADIIGHNIETVPRLYPLLREGADYRWSLRVLRIIKERSPAVYTKSGIMLGLGETEGEVLEVLKDLRKVGCDFLSIGQYLRPTSRHFPVREYVEPYRFLHYKDMAQKLGFLHTESGPYVRSSYLAPNYFNKSL